MTVHTRRTDDEARQADAAAAAGRHLRAAVERIDGTFGEGYAREHPELVASMVQAMTIEAAVATGREAHEQVLEVVQRVSRETNDTILRMKPRLFG
jgi:hypothetical protein